MGSAGAPLVARQLMKLRLSAVWVAMVAFRDSVPLPAGCAGMEGAFIEGDDTLSWVANNSAKLGLSHGRLLPGMQCWTLISTNSYGQKNKARCCVVLTFLR